MTDQSENSTEREDQLKIRLETAEFLKKKIDELTRNPDCEFVAVYGIRTVRNGSEIDVYSNLDDNVRSVMVIATTSSQIAAMHLGIGDGSVKEIPLDNKTTEH